MALEQNVSNESARVVVQDLLVVLHVGEVPEEFLLPGLGGGVDFGVFGSFGTRRLSQLSLCRHHWRRRGEVFQRSPRKQGFCKKLCLFFPDLGPMDSDLLLALGEHRVAWTTLYGRGRAAWAAGLR